MKNDLLFRCENCGGRIVRYDGKEYRAPETKNTKPLRQILSERKKKAGRQLCDACWEKFIHQKRRTKCDLQGTGVFRG